MKISLCGSAPSSAQLAPFEDKSWDEWREGAPHPSRSIGIHWPDQFLAEDWEIWGCSPALAGMARRVTRWFELHRWEPGQTWFQPNYLSYLREFRGPVYIGGPIPQADIPNQVMFPIDRVVQEFTSYFLTSSLALMCALAILEIEDRRKANPDHDVQDDVIAFFGVDMAAAEEWSWQRPGCQHFILEALRRNIGIYVPPESCLLIPMPVYALCEWDHKYIKMTQRSRELNTRRRELQTQFEMAKEQLAGVMGAQTDLDYYVNTLTSPYCLPAGEVIRIQNGSEPDYRAPTANAGSGEGKSHKRGRPRRKEQGNGPLAAQSGVPD